MSANFSTQKDQK